MRLLALLLGVLLASHCDAQAYPSRPVRMVVPLAAGGTGDTLARFVSEEMARILGQAFVVENRPGSGGVIGTEAVAKSAPDGYTLLSASPSHVIHPALRPNAGYHPIKDFEPITVIANTHQLIVGHPSVPAANVKELVAYARKNPGKLNYGSAGSGSATHLNMELFKTMSGTFIVHIPYRGSTQSRQDLVAGEVQLSVDGLLPTLPLIRAGKLRAFGLTSSRRSSVAPEIPTLAEAGITGYASDTWYGMVAPAGTPKEIVQTLHAAAVKAINTPAVRERLTQQGAELVGGTPEEFRKLLERELVLWTKVVKDSGAKVD
jgi:tripartite-type tricarboxylate transporter receptor subunit TctC